MPYRPISILRPSLLLVEGEEEKRFWQEVLKARGRTDVQVHPLEGKYGLPGKLSAISKTPGFDGVEWMAVARDADEDPRGAFQSICGALREAGLSVPRRPWVATGSSPKVVAVVLPDGAAPGDLEALVWRALEGGQVAACVHAYFDCLRNGGADLPRQLHKGRVHAYLASLSRPDLRLGEAAQAGLLPLEHPVFDGLLGLLPPP